MGQALFRALQPLGPTGAWIVLTLLGLGIGRAIWILIHERRGRGPSPGASPDEPAAGSGRD
jgi:hypothetical protein